MHLFFLELPETSRMNRSFLRSRRSFDAATSIYQLSVWPGLQKILMRSELELGRALRSTVAWTHAPLQFFLQNYSTLRVTIARQKRFSSCEKRSAPRLAPFITLLFLQLYLRLWLKD